MEIDIKLLDKCPELTDYEKDLIKRVDINHETQTSLAKHYGKTPSTICIQHKRALRKLERWTRSRETQKSSIMDFDAQAFKLFNKGLPPNKVIEELGRADRVYKLWNMYEKSMQNDYCVALNILFKWIKKEECSKYPVEEYPLAARVEKLRWDEFGLSLEHGCTWDLLKENGLTFGLEDEDFSVYESVKKLIEKIDKPQRI